MLLRCPIGQEQEDCKALPSLSVRVQVPLPSSSSDGNRAFSSLIWTEPFAVDSWGKRVGTFLVQFHPDVVEYSLLGVHLGIETLDNLIVSE